MSQFNHAIINGGICNKCVGRILGRTEIFINYSKHERASDVHVFVQYLCREGGGGEVLLKLFWTIFKDKHAEARRAEV